MRSNIFKSILGKSGIAAAVLMLASGASLAAELNLTAGPATANLPDGSAVPMWGYSCDTTQVAGHTGTCAALKPGTVAGVWSPVVITVPAGENLRIHLTNALTSAGTPIPTSLTIVGQLGGGLGTPGSTTASPTHTTQTLTWPASSTNPADGANTPPPQGARVQSFSTEVAPGATAQLDWANPRPGTYLLESGTHPSIQGPMGLYGIVVVTTAPAGTSAGIAYPGINYNADVPLLFSEIDPVQNNAVNTAVNTAGFSETKVWSGQPGNCGNPSSPAGVVNTCYPPAVNYAPLYYMINGVAFDKTHAATSLFATSPATSVTGTVLVRLVNAGLRMHVPAIVGAQTGSAVSGFGLIAEDGNPLPGVTRVQNEVFLAAGKTYDVTVNVPAGTALPIFDRQGSVSGNAVNRDAGMLGYISVNGAGLPSATSLGGATAHPDSYPFVVAGKTLSVMDPSKGVIANDVNVSGVKVIGTVAGLTLNANGTFTYTGPATTFTYCGNGTIAGAACATVSLTNAAIESGSGITCTVPTYTSTVATTLTIKPPGVLASCKDVAGYPLTIAASFVPTLSGGTVAVDQNGGFTATVAASGSHTLSFKPVNSQGTVSSSTMTATLVFPAASGLAVSVVDGQDKVTPITDYRWIIEEDRTFYVDPNCQTNPLPAGCPVVNALNAPAVFGTNFHTSYMPVVAQGCVGTISCEAGQMVLDPISGTHVSAVCDIGNGACRAGATKTPVDPSQVHLDPSKHYYISVLPGDAMDPGHAMGGAQIAPACSPAPCTSGTFAPVRVLVEPESQKGANLSVFVFEDDHPLNGEHDAGGGVDTLSPDEPGLGGFNITIFDLVGGTGDSAGQLTYDEFNQPLSNALAGTVDPLSGSDACPITANPFTGADGVTNDSGITGVIPVCPNYEADGVTLSPLGGQAVVAGLPPGKYGIVATPAADRIARGEEWLQTNTLDGGKDLETFLKINEPSYFQEFGPAGYHVSMGFANPKYITDNGTQLCTGAGAPACTHSVSGIVTGVHMSRPSDERLYGTGTRDTFGYTQCFVSLGSPDGADIAFTKCNPDDGTFSLSGIPAGDWRITIFDQWNDQIVDGITTPVRVGTSGDVNMGEIAVHAWKNNLSTRTCIDSNRDGVCQPGEAGLPLVATNIRFRDGSISNLNSTDLDGYAGFNEVFPLFNWYVMETDSTRYKNTGTHVVNDAGGPVDGSIGPYGCGQTGYPACGGSTLLTNMARTNEDYPLPTALRVPGAVYCGPMDSDCANDNLLNHPTGGGPGGSTGRVDPGWVTSYGWQSFAGQNQYLEFGKIPFASGENGGIRGHVVYTSTRPFDDPALLLQLTWEPMVPHVTINLYQVGTAPDGSQSLKMVDSTQTSSWDDWAQGFRSDGVPNMNCPGQSPSDPFFYTMKDQPHYLDWYNAQHGGPAATALPNDAQYKCYDGMHNWNQLQPAPYDGMYKFPSVLGRNPTTGVPVGSNCSICVTGPDGAPMLPAGKYVVEMVVPPGYELVKEEDKNILLGDTYDGFVTTQFAGLGNIFIMPDQASIAAYNANNPLNMTTDLGAQPRHEGDTGSVEVFWPCVGAPRVVPDYNSLFPGVQQNSPFAGATRNLCDRKLVTLEDQMSVLAKFYVFSSTHVAGHFTGVISDDFTSEFDPFSPHFGEKFSPANLPVSVKDWAGNEISRVYSDMQGNYTGLNYSSFSVNPPDPSGYIPQMMVVCMNDRGTGPTPDPLYQTAYSQFCYELPFMPGQTGYFDTPVIPTASFAAEYNHPDCAYPDATPGVSEVDGDATGPWIAAGGSGHPITIHSLGDQLVTNYGYSGPNNTANPYNKKTFTRHYGFGATQGTGSVKIGGITASITSWSDTKIVVTLPTTGPQVPNCPLQQQAQYGGSSARCGELAITAGNGKTSVDTVTVTIGGKVPTVLGAGQTIQSAIDAASPGDMIVVPAGKYHELVLMWKPVRLQGVGAASSVLDANAQPAGILNDWRLRVVCLFGLTPAGAPAGYDPSCGNGWNYFVPTTVGADATRHVVNPQVDRLTLEGAVGWTATLNGNLAEQLQEPTLMGAYEGAGITVLAKGVRFPNGSNPFADEAFPVGTQLLTAGNASMNGRGCGSNANNNANPSNFLCNPSRIDGLSVTNSSQGGGGIYVHGWAHNLEISNNRVNNNQGTLSGGITVGQGEHPDAYIQGDAAGTPDPGSCQTSGVNGTQLPYCFDRFVNVHHNAVTSNANEGDELFSATPSGAGGVAFCTGSDNYQFNYNWVCGNLTSGDGAGVSQLGFVYNGSINHNTILFNQAVNPTTPSNGGGLLILSAPDTDPTCPSGGADADCNHAFGTVGDGIGPGLTINANLIMGNAAEAGAGGGIRFQAVNGSEVSTFPTNPARWYTVSVTNNIITNNVAGWDGAGVSLQDSLAIDLINNTIVSNDSTASSGSLFGAFFATQASAPTPCPPDVMLNGASGSCVPLSTPQPAGISSAGHTAEFMASLPGSIRCPVGHGLGGSGDGRTNGACRTVSFPILYNDVIWQNRAFNIDVVVPSTGAQQSTVSLVPALNQTSTGFCAPTNAYWDIGLRGDTGPANHSSGVTFTPQASVLTNTAGYPGGGSGFRANTSDTPRLVSQYCNGSKVPPEAGGAAWYQVPPGTNESNVPIPVFNLTAGATVDEGNNWISIAWGPLSLIKPATELTPATGTSASSEAVLADYSLGAGATAINYVSNANSTNTYSVAPPNDFFEVARKTNGRVDVGAVEFTGPVVAPIVTLSPASHNFGNVLLPVTTSTAPTFDFTLSNTAAAGGDFTIGTITVGNLPFSRVSPGATNCGTTLVAGASCTIRVRFQPNGAQAYSGSVTVTGTDPGGGAVAVSSSPAALTGSGVVPRGTLTIDSVTNGTLGSVLGVPTLTFTIPSPRAPVNSVVTVRNTGTAPLTITAENLLINLPAGSFGLNPALSANTCTTTLAINATCVFTVRYATPATAPTSARIGTVAIRNNGSGTLGAPPPAYSPMGLIAQ